MWAYRSDLISTADAGPGSAAVVKDERGKLLGTGLYSSASQIALRLLSTEVLGGEDQLIALLRQRVGRAVDYRSGLLREGTGTDACRLIYSEADGLPGLIVDRYNDVLSLQALTQAMDRDPVKQAIVEELLNRLGPKVATLVERIEPRIRELEQLPAAASHLVRGDKTATVYSLNGVRFHYDGLSGQKTGAFLDQRENYAAAEHYAHGRALDVFCYQGGFALHLARKCRSVTAVDGSRPALEVGEQNAALNQREGIPEIEWMEANAFDVLKDYAAAGQRYDTIVLDPPAFAKSKRQLDAAMGGYKELNLRALKCSHRVECWLPAAVLIM